MNYIPASQIAEWHITYRCDIKCHGCNRFCSSLKDVPPDMTMSDVEKFCQSARSLGWKPSIVILGGEPTLHEQFKDIVVRASEFAAGRVRVLSNAYRDEAKKKLQEVATVASIRRQTHKKEGPVSHPILDYCIAPVDFGCSREPCQFHSTKRSCGISVDSLGYTTCCVGGAIDSMLRLGVRTKELAQLFDPQFAERQTKTLCNHCGCNWGDGRPIAGIREGMPVTKTWMKAFDGD